MTYVKDGFLAYAKLGRLMIACMRGEENCFLKIDECMYEREGEKLLLLG